MNNFTISQLAQFSGVKAHAIRMWEQRHQALSPQRTEGGTRYYDNQQLRRLLNIVSLQETGRRISELCAMSDQDLFDLLKKQDFSISENSDSPNTDFFITQLLAAGMDYDTNYFEKLFGHCILRFGLKNTYIQIVYPMLKRIGFLWTTNELPPTQEHFISNLLRQKIFTAIDALPPAPDNAPKWLLFLPENEFHEIGLLMADYLLKSAGQKTIYLGSNVPLSSLVSVGEDLEPEFLLYFLVHRNLPDEIISYYKNLEEFFPEAYQIISCDPELVQQVDFKKSVQPLHSLEDLEQFLEEKLIPVI